MATRPPNTRIVMRYWNEDNQQQVSQEFLTLESPKGKAKVPVEITWPDDCPWPPVRVRQMQIEISAPRPARPERPPRPARPPRPSRRGG